MVNPFILTISDENQNKQNGESNRHIDGWRSSNSEEEPKLDDNRDGILISTDGHYTTITSTGKFSLSCKSRNAFRFYYSNSMRLRYHPFQLYSFLLLKFDPCALFSSE